MVFPDMEYAGSQVRLDILASCLGEDASNCISDYFKEGQLTIIE